MAGARQGALCILVPARAGVGAFAHLRRIDVRRKRQGVVFKWHVAVNRPVWVQVIVGTCNRCHSTVYNRTPENVVHTGNAGHNIVAEP